MTTFHASPRKDCSLCRHSHLMYGALLCCRYANAHPTNFCRSENAQCGPDALHWEQRFENDDEGRGDWNGDDA